MKKILSTKTTGPGADRLVSNLKHLVETDAEVAALAGEICVREAWALSYDRVKVRAEVRLPDGSYCTLTRVVSMPLPPEIKCSYRGWTIFIVSNWYGYAYRLLDESGEMAGESAVGVGESQYAEENARREVNRLLAARVSGTPLATLPKNAPSLEKPAPLATLEATVLSLPRRQRRRPKNL